MWLPLTGIALGSYHGFHMPGLLEFIQVGPFFEEASKPPLLQPLSTMSFPQDSKHDASLSEAEKQGQEHGVLQSSLTSMSHANLKLNSRPRGDRSARLRRPQYRQGCRHCRCPRYVSPLFFPRSIYGLHSDSEDDSPYPEVRSAVANTDDPDIPVSTLRSWVLGLVWAIIIPVRWPGICFKHSFSFL